MIELPVCSHRVRIKGGQIFCLSLQASGDPHSRPPYDEKYCLECGFDKGLGSTPAPVLKPRMSISEVAGLNAKRRRCQERKSAGLPCEEFSAPKEMKPVEWMYGVTTVKRREKHLERTLGSLSVAGFDRPQLFVDGYHYTGPLEATCRVPRLKLLGNWALGLAELYIRNPRADRYAMFQDDIIACRNLREYLSKWYPHDGYMNLILYPCNGKPGAKGWYRAPFKGQGAQGLVFSRAALIALLSHIEFIQRPAVAGPRSWKYLDGGINGVMAKCKFAEYVHSPSLLGHTGLQSSIQNSQQPHIPHSVEYDPCSATA